MTEPVVAQSGPFPIAVEAGRTYLWCACGLSATQPFCDGSHRSTDFQPVTWTAKRTATAYFCGCKRSLNAPLCDGTHGKI
ncbi:MAG TPA: CDGSH iron-sulfur domain-containing protein [Beijerinckiaceae bacterium]|nr:CDGSH iron-sulfur domain-containing protein [Beijerinckiaceae bacterium]